MFSGSAAQRQQATSSFLKNATKATPLTEVGGLTYYDNAPLAHGHSWNVVLEKMGGGTEEAGRGELDVKGLFPDLKTKQQQADSSSDSGGGGSVTSSTSSDSDSATASNGKLQAWLARVHAYPAAPPDPQSGAIKRDITGIAGAAEPPKPKKRK